MFRHQVSGLETVFIHIFRKSFGQWRPQRLYTALYNKVEASLLWLTWLKLPWLKLAWISLCKIGLGLLLYWNFSHSYSARIFIWFRNRDKPALSLQFATSWQRLQLSMYTTIKPTALCISHVSVDSCSSRTLMGNTKLASSSFPFVTAFSPSVFQSSGHLFKCDERPNDAWSKKAHQSVFSQYSSKHGFSMTLPLSWLPILRSAP